MIRGTTPVITLEIEGADLTGQTVYVTFTQTSRQVTKTNDSLEIIPDANGCIIRCRLTQTDTLTLVEGFANVQARYVDASGNAGATDSASIEVEPVSLERVILYAGC